MSCFFLTQVDKLLNASCAYHIPAWCPGGCNEGERDVTHLTNSQSRHQGHINAARQVARATELGTVTTNNCGS
jgi:hypothetical protein